MGNINTYKGMIHHGEGGMVAPGQCPLTVGSGSGHVEKKPKAMGSENMAKGGEVSDRLKGKGHPLAAGLNKGGKVKK